MNNDNTTQNNSTLHLTCEHAASDTFSGDLICTKCGQVLQGNSQLSSEPSFLDRLANFSSKPPETIFKLSHQERSELSLQSLARKLISSFALKASYEAEALELMHRHWKETECKQKYGLGGNKLLVAAMFLLARRDHLAVNLTLLSAAIDSNPQECGAYFDSLIKLDPSLRSLARVSDYVERCLDLLIKELSLKYQLVILDLHALNQQTDKIAKLVQSSESGSSKSAECVALAAAWISLSALLRLESSKINLETVVQDVCDTSTLSFKSVKLKYSNLIEKLMERATQLLPSTFATVPLTKPKKLALLLDNLDLIIN